MVLCKCITINNKIGTSKMLWCCIAIRHYICFYLDFLKYKWANKIVKLRVFPNAIHFNYAKCVNTLFP